MKTIYLLVLSLSVLTSAAQAPQPVTEFENELLKFSRKETVNHLALAKLQLASFQPTVCPKDSMISLNWNQALGTWNLEVRNIYTNDFALRRVIDQIRQKNAGQVTYEGKKLMTYDQFSNMTQSLTRSLTPQNSYADAQKENRTYDGLNNPTELLYSEWTGASWRQLTRFASTFTGTNVLTEGMQFYDASINGLKNGYQNVYSYDQNGFLLSVLVQTWRNNNWVDVQKEFYSYNVNGDMTQTIWQLWDTLTSTWVNSWRVPVMMNNRVVSSYTNQLWDNNGSFWEDQEKADFSFDANGNLLTENHFNKTFSGWVGSSRYSHTYDSRNLLTSTLSEHMNNGTWVNNSRRTYTYQPQGNETVAFTEIWSPNLNSWNNFSLVKSYYDCTQVGLPENGNNKFSIYPNPAGDDITVLSPGRLVALSIYDVTGALMLSSDQSQIDVRSLAAGIYFLKATDAGGGTFNTKVLKQ
jgi:hypothetical protein